MDNKTSKYIDIERPIIAPTKGNKKTTIYLAGDSTVKTYNSKQFIVGWGQYLNNFLFDDIIVENAAEGGRSSRSFINEGRLFTIIDNTENKKLIGGGIVSGTSIEDCMKPGDYLFIQFGHNDDASKKGNSLIDRMVPLGEADSNGIYPTNPGVPTKIEKGKESLAVSQEVKKIMNNNDVVNDFINKHLKKYGTSYYEYSSGGTYKWFLKQYIKFSRDRGAIPVLITPLARKSFNKNGKIKSGPGLHGIEFGYVKAVRQLAKEENCLLIDLFSDTIDMLET